MTEEDALVGAQLQLPGEPGSIAVVKPGRKPLRGDEQIDVAGDEPRVDVVVGPLHRGVLQPRLLEARCVGEPVDVYDVEQLHRRFHRDVLLARSYGHGPQVARDDRKQPVVTGVEEVDPVLQGEVTRIALATGRPVHLACVYLANPPEAWKSGLAFLDSLAAAGGRGDIDFAMDL